ncbi:MAG: hypothetical protein WA584_13755 [Pyrinomonadaceae bacterium]
MDEFINQIQDYLPILKSWKSSLEPWIAIISLAISVITLFYARQSYRLQTQSYRESERLKKELELKDKEEKESLKKQRKKVPDSIFFGDEILLIPNMEEVGIPKELRTLGNVQPQIQIGGWVERGEEILTVTYDVFEKNEKPKHWFLSDNTFSTKETLKSPVSGLVIGYRNEHGGYEEVFPIILLPKDEPPQQSYQIYFYERIVRTLDTYWHNICCYYSHHRYDRLKDIKPELKYQRIERIALKDFKIRKITSDDKTTLYRAQSLRENDLILRDKLVDLVKEKLIEN